MSAKNINGKDFANKKVVYAEKNRWYAIGETYGGDFNAD